MLWTTLLACTDYTLEPDPARYGVCDEESWQAGSVAPEEATCAPVEVEWEAGLRLLTEASIGVDTMGEVQHDPVSSVLPAAHGGHPQLLLTRSRRLFQFQANGRLTALPAAPEALRGDDSSSLASLRWGGRSLVGANTIGVPTPSLLVSDVATQLDVARFDDEGVLGDHEGTLVVADIDRDGVPDVLTTEASLSVDGSLVMSFGGSGVSESIAAPAVADLDGDGVNEVLTRSARVDWVHGAGQPWGSRASGPLILDGQVGVLGVPGQPPRVVVSGLYMVSAFDAASTDELWSLGRVFHGAWAGGDVDGDGLPELCFPGTASLVLTSIEGETIWERDRRTSEYSPGSCVMADLDGDGRYEVLDQDLDGLRVLDGRSGDELARAAGSVNPYPFGDSPPMVADLDGDRSADIVLFGAGPGCEGTWRCDDERVQIYSATSGRFARTRPVWNQSSYVANTIRDDGTIVTDPLPMWETYNSFRAQPAHDGAFADLVPVLLETCDDECSDGVIGVMARVENRGSVDAAPGAVLRVLTNASGTLQAVASIELEEGVPTLTSTAGYRFDIPLADWGSRQVLEVENPERYNECDFVNNRLQLETRDVCE